MNLRLIGLARRTGIEAMADTVFLFPTEFEGALLASRRRWQRRVKPCIHWVDATGAPRAWVIGVGPHARNAVSRLPVGTAGSIWVLGGFCGALDPALISGDVLVVQGERLLEKLT